MRQKSNLKINKNKIIKERSEKTKEEVNSTVFATNDQKEWESF